MNEIEVKILDVSHKNLEKRLLELGAKKVFDGILTAVNFDRESNELRNNNQVLRIRREGDNCILTYKKKIKNSVYKEYQEIETNIGSFEKGIEILENLGYKIIFNNRKQRVSYHLPNGVHFDFDNFLDEKSYIPEFLEIEAKDNKTLEKYASILGFKRDQLLNWSLSDLEIHYSK